jgi:hypothetical protein
VLVSTVQFIGISMCGYWSYKSALEKAYWIPGWQSIKEGLRWEVPLIVAGAVVAGAMEWPDVIETIIRGLIGGGAVLLLIIVYQLGRYAVAAPYRLWKIQHDEVVSLKQKLDRTKPRVSFSVSNADEYLQSRSTYMFKIRNNGEGSNNCLVRLSAVVQNGASRPYDRVLPTKGQWEQERRGQFNLRAGEPKYVMLIGNFPDGWRFIFENGLSDAFQLDRPISAEIAVYGCGPLSSAVILIELLDESLKLLRLTLKE